MNKKNYLLPSIFFAIFLCVVGCSANNEQESLPATTTEIQNLSTTSSALVEETLEETTSTQVEENLDNDAELSEIEEKGPLNPDEAPEGEDFQFTDFEARDPELVFDGSTAYLYTTNIFADWGKSINLPIWKTENFTEYEFLGDGLEELGAWAEEEWTWAPGVIEINPNKWIVFYTARMTGTTDDPAYPAGVQCIGKAIS